MENIIEKYIDLTEAGALYTIQKHLACGWYIYFEGITSVILRKQTEGAQ